MKKDDGISILLSIIINIIIVLLIPSLSANKVENKKIKIGLVAYENKNRTKLEGQKNSNTSQKKTAEELKKIPPKKEVTKVEKPVEDEEQNAEQEVKKEEKKTTPKSDKIDLSALNNIASSVSVPKVEVMTSVQPKSSGYREVAVLEISKKELQSGVTSKNKASENITLSKELISAENEKLELNDEDKIAFNSEIGKDSSFDRILQISGETEGLPSGYRLGTEDGDIVARWDTSNREPVYPESAQLKGLHGSVKIRMNIDENGNVHSCTTPECPICRVFGRGAGDNEIAKSGPTRISVKDAYLTQESREILEKLREKVGFDTEWKYENNINRLTSRNSERIPAGIKFEFSISYKVFDMNDNGKLDEELFEKVVLKGLKTLLIEGIGGGVSRGNGQIRFVKLDVDGESYIDKIENISIR